MKKDTIPLHTHGNEMPRMNSGKKRFSLRYKLIIIFGVLIASASFIEGVLAVRAATKAGTEKKPNRLTAI